MDRNQLRIMAEIFAQHALVLGMQADNQSAAANGLPPYYVNTDFAHHANLLEQLGQEAMKPQE